jgi:hypothetical protein
MRAVVIAVMIGALVGCVTPHKEPSGKYVKVAPTEDRSAFGTNLTFGRLERCEGPAKAVLFYTHGDFSNCVLLTKAEQDEWMFGYSRGAGPEIAGAAIVGASVGVGAAMSGGSAAASAGASATNTAIQSVTVGKHRR